MVHIVWIVFCLFAISILEAFPFCFIDPSGCRDPDTNLDKEIGASWTTQDCVDCSCFPGPEEYLETCFEVDSSKESEHLIKAVQRYPIKVIISRIALLKTSESRKVILSSEEAQTFQCPPLPEEFLDKSEKLREVHYYITRKETSCCSKYGTPTNLHNDCESIWIQEDCRYDIVSRNSTSPCPHPFMMVGK
ncbi:uncharacterized protein LOC143469009 [Clavelina lepadiformis]|uniref:uncharacterized protein LOC143469009 n=1 Tax=Clavelina lepadiformis TaxID=159417 RepID=UPI00404362C9